MIGGKTMVLAVRYTSKERGGESGERGGGAEEGGVIGADLRARRLLMESSSLANLATVEPGGAAEAPTPPADAKP